MSPVGGRRFAMRMRRDTLPPGREAAAAQRSADSGRAVGAAIGAVRGVDLLDEFIVGAGSSALGATRPCIEAAAGDLHDAAKLAYREGLPILLDEAESHFCSSAK